MDDQMTENCTENFSRTCTPARRNRNTEGDRRYRESVQSIGFRSPVVSVRGYRSARIGRPSSTDDRDAAYHKPAPEVWIEPAAPTAFEAALTMKPCRALMGLPCC